MITVFSGENDYELTKKVAQLKADFDGTAERYDANELSKEQLADIFAGQTLFSTARLVILDASSTNPDLWANIADWVGRLSDDTQMVLVEPKLDKRTSTYKWLKKNAQILEFSTFDPRDMRGLTQWIDTYAKQKHVPLTGPQSRRLAERAGANQWELAHAIDKLALAGGVTDQWIDDVTQASPTENVFALFETVLNGDVERLQAMLQTLKLSEDPYRMFGLINSQGLQLAVLTYGDGDVAKVTADTGASSSYPYQKLAPFAVRLTKGQARKMIALLAVSDMRLKTSDADPWLVLESTLAQMASLSND